MAERVDLLEKLAAIDRPWSPRIVGELNGQHVKLAKISGEFPWHSHPDEDELFLVIEGAFDLEFRDHTVHLGPGQFCIAPRGVEHRPVGEASVLLFEPASTRNTGDLDNEYTIEPTELERL